MTHTTAAQDAKIAALAANDAASAIVDLDRESAHQLAALRAYAKPGTETPSSAWISAMGAASVASALGVTLADDGRWTAEGEEALAVYDRAFLEAIAHEIAERS